MNEDYRDILVALIAQDVRFLVVGAHALAAHGYPRATVDLDIWMLEGVTVPVIGLDDLVANKRASGRDRDRADLKGLQGKN